MPNLTLLIPLRLPPEHGFFNPAGLQDQKLLGFTVQLKLEPPPSGVEGKLQLPSYSYIELLEVPPDQANDVLERVRRCLKWAAVRLDMGIDTDREPLKRAADTVFDGQFATAYPSGNPARPMRMEMSSRGVEPSNRLFAALNEGASSSEIVGPTAKKSSLLACEFFAATDFEITPNSKFLMLSTVLEVLADPKPRPTLCIYLVEELLENVNKAVPPGMAIRKCPRRWRACATPWFTTKKNRSRVQFGSWQPRLPEPLAILTRRWQEGGP